MGIYNQGTMVKTKQVHTDEYGTCQYVLHAKEGGMTFRRCQDYYWHLKREFDQCHGVYCEQNHPYIKTRDRENLERMCYGASFGVCDDTIHLDNWAVNEEFIFHKHPEFGVVQDFMGERAEQEYSVSKGKCDLCATEIPGEVEFLHKMYQL
jgi:hypothetical protein